MKKSLFVPYTYPIDKTDSEAMVALKRIYNLTAGKSELREINSIAFAVIDGPDPDYDF